MTTDEAAARLGLSPHTVKYHCQQRHIQATKHGRDWWITEDALEDFIATRQIGPGNKTGRPRRPTPPGTGTGGQEETRT